MRTASEKTFLCTQCETKPCLLTLENLHSWCGWENCFHLITELQDRNLETKYVPTGIRHATTGQGWERNAQLVPLCRGRKASEKLMVQGANRAVLSQSCVPAHRRSRPRGGEGVRSGAALRLCWERLGAVLCWALRVRASTFHFSKRGCFI